MDNVKGNEYYVKKIIEDLHFIVDHMKDISLADMESNVLLQDSMMFRMIQVSENSRKLSDSFRATNTTIPWTAMFGLRNRIVHDYGNVNLKIIYSTLKDDIPSLLSRMESTVFLT